MVLQKSFPSVKKRTVTRPPGGELGGAMFKAYQPALAPPHPYSVLPTNPIQRIKTTKNQNDTKKNKDKVHKDVEEKVPGR